MKLAYLAGGCFWGMEELFVSAGDDREMGLFELSSRDIILFTRHPEAVSARNLLKCTVVDTFPSGNKVGVELRCGHETLIAEETAGASTNACPSVIGIVHPSLGGIVAAAYSLTRAVTNVYVMPVGFGSDSAEGMHQWAARDLSRRLGVKSDR